LLIEKMPRIAGKFLVKSYCPPSREAKNSKAGIADKACHPVVGLQGLAEQL
jgi:hypothetical protein